MSSLYSYKDKLDPRVLSTINGILALYQILAVDEGGTESLLPELIEKFKKERCPDYPQMSLMDTDAESQ